MSRGGYGVNLWPMAALACIGFVAGVYHLARFVYWVCRHLHWS